MTFDLELKERFRPLAAAQGPFVSVYLDDSRDAADAEEQIAARWGDIRRQLEDAGADEDIVAVVGDAILHGEPGVEDRATIAPDADVLSELGEAPSRVARADEALPFAAISVGASVIWVDGGIDPADGVGALLRYAPSDVPHSEASSRESALR